MKKNFKSYALIWGILFAVFNAVVFIARSAMSKYLGFDTSFWIAWALVIVAFLGNLACSHFAFKAKNANKLFYNLPLITVSWLALLVMLVIGCVIMLIPKCPSWIASIISILVLAFNAITVVKAKWASDTISTLDEKIKVQASFIKNITANAQNLIEHAKSDAVKAEGKKVYEAFRYSDPMSNPHLSTIENNISEKMDKFAEAVDRDDTEKISEYAKGIIMLVKERNNKCQRLK